ncbi:hypothetical protein GEMRC1_011574 [Eukaryota sp. GEM-RC1]
MSDTIDESLYSRSLYVLGHEALKRMSETAVLVSGMSGVGAEVAKNLILSGMKAVTIHDTQNVQPRDLGSNFYLTEDHVGSNRALACFPRFRSLNTYVEVNAITCTLTEEILSQFSVVVLTDVAESDLLNISTFCHNAGIKFVLADSRGVTARLFCDFGPSHTVLDPDGEPTNTFVISNIEKGDSFTTFYLADDHAEKISWSSGSTVKLNGLVGFPELNDVSVETEVLSPYTFRVNIPTINNPAEFKTGYVTPSKESSTMVFEPYSIQAKKPALNGYLGSTIEPEVTHVMYLALDQFYQMHSRLPRIDSPSDPSDVLLMMDNIVKLTGLSISLDKIRDKLIRLIRISACVLSPISAIIGGIAAQEVLKACSGKFSPFHQFFYYDAYEVLPNEDVAIEERMPMLSRYDDQIVIFGRELQKLFQTKSLFVVGAGAIGCEVLKSVALMGVSCSNNAKTVVTDMDIIEKSNLNRQFLFTYDDIHKPKSEVAAKAVKTMNRDLSITATQIAVGPETEEVYNDEFFSTVDVIINALDNIEARMFMDSKAVYYCKPLVESGTLGTKGNVQVVIPHLTKSYGESQDPPEKSVPMCTIKNFPYQIEHTIEWARQYFEETFTNAVTDAARYLKNPEFLNTLKRTVPVNHYPHSRTSTTI